MKKILLPLLLLISVSVQAQSVLSNFSIEENAIVYKYIFEPSDTVNLKERLLLQLRSTRGIENVEDKGNYISANLKNFPNE